MKVHCPHSRLIIAKVFFDKHAKEHELSHRDALLELNTISLPDHLDTNKRAKLYRSKKYRLTLSRTSLSLLIHYLMEKQDAGGQVVLRLMNRWLDIKIIPGAPTDPIDEVGGVDGEASMDHEGVDTREPLSLGPMPRDPDMMDDVQAELRDQDMRNGAPVNGEMSLSQAWSKVKREPMEDSPARDLIPLPT
jgi:transcription initiation factor TFIID subunit 5